MIPRARWAHTKESATRATQWRLRARARAALALGSALACAVVTSALMLSGSVRALRDAMRDGIERDGTQVVAEAAVHTTSSVQRGMGGEVVQRRIVPRAEAPLGRRADPAIEITPSRAALGSSMTSQSRGSDLARGYDAMAPPVVRV